MIGVAAADSRHVLHQLLPPLSSASQNYSLRHRTHQFSLPDHTERLMDCNCLIGPCSRMFINLY